MKESETVWVVSGTILKKKKASKDASTSRIYAKFGREIYVAAKQGEPNPESNQTLRVVLERAKTYNVPKKQLLIVPSKRQRAAQRKNYTELRYEGFGPSGSMIIVDALTNNVNRTAAEVRAPFNKKTVAT
ncbi:hypothetical protein GCM10020331_090720 [Ectobacillus funiculus]